MKPLTIQAHRVPSAGANDAPRLVVPLVSGREVVVAGAILEGAFETEAGTLLVTTDDVPFEEIVHLVLLRRGAVRDQWDIGFPYTPGTVSGLLATRGTLVFSFADQRFRVTASERGRFVLPGSAPAEARRGVAPWRRAHILVENISE